jgi:hypothetical protein
MRKQFRFGWLGTRKSRNSALGLAAGLVLGLGLFACPRTPAAASQHVRLRVGLLCEQQNELGDDEIYIPVSLCYHYPSGYWAWQSWLWWQGDVTDDDPDRRGIEGLLWEGDLDPGESVVATYNVFEQDGMNWEPGLKVAAELAQKAAEAYAAGQASGGGAGAEESDILAALQGTDVDGIIGKICAVFGCTNTDDYIGTFNIIIRCNADGSLTSHVQPIARSRFLSNGRLQLDGDGARYYPGVNINGVQVPQDYHF